MLNSQQNFIKGDIMISKPIHWLYKMALNKSYIQSIGLVLLLSLTVLLNGCKTIVGASTDEPIQVDPGKRLLGTYINDERVETIAEVNIDKAHPDLKKANVNVTLFNDMSNLGYVNVIKNLDKIEIKSLEALQDE